MDRSVIGLIMSLLLDILAFLIFFLLFYHYRKIRSAPPIEEMPNITINRPFICERNESLKSIYSKMLRMSDSELEESLGRMPITFLNFNRYLFYTLCLVSFVGLLMLLPIYASGDTEVKHDMTKIGIIHIIYDQNLLMASVLAIVLISGITALFMYLQVRKFSDQEIDVSYIQPKDIGNFSVLVRGLPQDKAAQMMQQEFRKIVNEQFEEYVIDTYVIGDYTKAFQEWEHIQKYTEKLNHYNTYERVKGNRPLKTIHCFKKTDLIQEYETRLKQAQEKYKDDLLQAELASTGLAFIISDTYNHRNYILQNFIGKSDSLLSNRWKLKLGIHPSDINWHNLSHSKRATKFRRFSMNVLFFFIFFVFFSPTAFLHYCEEIAGESDMNRYIKNFITMVLPSLIPLIYQRLIVRQFVEITVRYEHHLTKTQDFISSYEKYVFFLIFYLFLIPAIGLSLQGMLIEIISGDMDLGKTFGIGLARSGQFFTMFIFHQAFIGLGSDLLDPARILVIKYRQREAVTEEEMLRAYEAEEYPWMLNFALSYVIFAIVICMSVIYPLIIVAGLVYFGMKVRTNQMGIHKYLILCGYYVHPINIMTTLNIKLLDSVLIGLALFQVGDR